MCRASIFKVMKKKVVTYGEVLLRLTAPGYLRFSQTTDYIATFGGSEANVAASLGCFGIENEFVTRLPDNEIALSCIGELRSLNVGTKHILFGGKRMGIYFLENAAVSRGSKVVYDREDSSFSTITPEMIDWDEIFADATWFHWSGVAAALSAETAQTCLDGIKAANRKGLTISCDLNFRKKLWNYGKKAVEVMPDMVAYSDVIFGSHDEFNSVLDVVMPGSMAVDTHYEPDFLSYEKAAKEVVARFPHCKKVFIEFRNTINANHNTLFSVLYSNGILKHSRVYDITHTVDPVGVGDAFAGGMIYGLSAYPDDDQKALDFAQAASALKNTIPGDFNLVSVNEVENLMQGDGSGRVSR